MLTHSKLDESWCYSYRSKEPDLNHCYLNKNIFCSRFRTIFSGDVHLQAGLWVVSN